MIHGRSGETAGATLADGEQLGGGGLKPTSAANALEAFVQGLVHRTRHRLARLLGEGLGEVVSLGIFYLCSMTCCTPW